MCSRCNLYSTARDTTICIDAHAPSHLPSSWDCMDNLTEDVKGGLRQQILLTCDTH
jgi:hypothetical protein